MTQMSTHREDKEAVVHMNNGLLVAERSQLGSFVQMCVDVGPLYQVKSERGKQISYMNPYMWDLENGTDESMSRAGIERQI